MLSTVNNRLGTAKAALVCYPLLQAGCVGGPVWDGYAMVFLVTLRSLIQNLSCPPSKCSNEAVLVATFHPTDPSLLITCGKSHIYFWSLEGGNLSKRQGLFEVSARDLWTE